MFPSTKNCLFNETNDRYSKFVIGILIITVASIFIASALTTDVHTDKNSGIADLVHNNMGDVSKISRFDDVSLAKKDDCVVSKNTEKGTIDIDWIACDDLPLCLTQDALDIWTGGTPGDPAPVIIAKIKGKYEPIGGVVDITQGDLDMWPWKFEDLPDLEIYWDSTPYMHEDCYYDYWYGYVKLPDDVYSIEFASNQWPDGARPVQWKGPHIPGKMVNFEFDIKYQGCSEEDQQFWLIMTHKNHFSNSQTPDYLKSSV